MRRRVGLWKYGDAIEGLRRWYEAELHSEARAGALVLRKYDYRGMPSVPGDVRLARLDVIARVNP